MRPLFRLPLVVFFTAAPCFAANQAAKPPPTKSVESIAAEARPSVVKVMQVGRDGMDGLGAGFVVSADGLIATNLHVIGEARRLGIETGDGQKHEVVEVTATDAHWDLALLRVAKKGPKPLKLADSDSLLQGQPIVAIGNPEGLEFSVVDGVVSAFPDVINGIPMIRVALPIEKGNSGGPVLNRLGEVVGLLTLKSARTENLGFAMPANELKRLIEKPNPVPMDRWLTIGVLNPKVWQPLMGARWSQHAGVIKAATSGTGFGGRSLCLYAAEQPKTPTFEVAAQVKLAEETGAAGLVFCSDGEDVHYGFYPSGGKLRLTRFEGPDIYSWTILADVSSAFYRAGDWNHLRVRVEPGHIVCFVNGHEVLRQPDTALRGGGVGLCKFRNTVAEFRGFRVGPDLSERPVAKELAATITASLDRFLNEQSGKDETLSSLVDQPAASRRLMIDRRRALEREAAALRDLEKELHRRAMTKEIIAELAKPEEKIDLIRCTLLLARHDNPEIDISHYMQTVARIVEELRHDEDIVAGGLSGVNRLSRYLFEENGFHGSRHDYESRSNSYMNEVLDDREGLPITLSVLFTELASRVGLDGVCGLPLPGRFMVGYREGPEGEWTLIDAFESGKVLTVQQAAADLTPTSVLDDVYLTPAPKRAIVLRILRNLISSTLDGQQTAAKDSIAYLNLLVALDPTAAMERIARARLNEQTGDKKAASEDVLWLTEHFPEDGPVETRLQLEQWLNTLRR